VTNKLAIIVCNRDVERQATRELVAKKFVFTRIGSTGGFLRKKNVTLLVGLADNRVNELITLLKKITPETDALIPADSGSMLGAEAGAPEVPLGAAPLRVGGATLFIVPVEQTVRF
jgi:uncharacterized protein YaaQ